MRVCPSWEGSLLAAQRRSTAFSALRVTGGAMAQLLGNYGSVADSTPPSAIPSLLTRRRTGAGVGRGPAALVAVGVVAALGVAAFFSAGIGRSSPILVRPDSGCHPQSEFGRIRTAVPNLSSAGFGRTGGFGRIRADGRVRPDSGGRGFRQERCPQVLLQDVIQRHLLLAWCGFDVLQ